MNFLTPKVWQGQPPFGKVRVKACFGSVCCHWPSLLVPCGGVGALGPSEAELQRCMLFPVVSSCHSKCHWVPNHALYHAGTMETDTLRKVLEEDNTEHHKNKQPNNKQTEAATNETNQTDILLAPW